MVKSQANTVLLALIVRIPNAHVRPRRGTNTMEATSKDLHEYSINLHVAKYKRINTLVECSNSDICAKSNTSTSYIHYHVLQWF